MRSTRGIRATPLKYPQGSRPRRAGRGAERGCLLPATRSDLPPSPPSRAELLDRYSQHTAHC
eukprot:2079190-Pyramimonas_sp.AAC.1